MSKQAFEKIKSGLDEAIIIAPYVAEIERLRAEVEQYKVDTNELCIEVEKLRAALKPFADDVDDYDFMEDQDVVGVAVGDLRAAAAAIRETGE